MLRPWFYGLSVALLGISGSVFLAFQQLESTRQVEQARFAQAANALTEALKRRIDAYTEIAFGLRGLFVVNPELSRKAFVDAVSHLSVDVRHPGTKNIAFTRYVLAQNKQSFEQQVRADTSIEPRGYPDFSIHPPGQRDEYFVADYLWPVNGNKGIQGLDISAQPANLASMRYSMQSGEPVASAPFDLLQETTHRTGFVIRVPVFGTPKKPSAAQKQGEQFLGSVAVTLRVFDLFQQLEREGRLQGLNVHLSDRGSTLTAAAANGDLPLFTNLPDSRTNASQYSSELSVYGRRWHLDFQPSQPFLSESERKTPWLMGVAGGLISLLLGTLVMLLARGRVHALARAAATGEALKDSEGRWRFAIEGAGDGLWDWNVSESSVFFSTRWKEMLGFSEEEIGHHLDEWEKRVHPDDKAQVMTDLQNHLSGATSLYVNEHRMQTKNGGWIWILDRGVVVSRDPSGKPLRMIGTHSDITEQKLAAQALRSSVQEKEALLKEVHHRVKNNLQVITSLLRLESRRSVQPDTRAVLGDMQGRIRSMALLHESLYRSGTFASVNLGDYLKQLATQAFNTQVTNPGDIQLKVNLASVQVGMDQAIPCGMLVNELISNCFKHGFPVGSSGYVQIELQPAYNAHLWRLRVSDTGVGLPVDFDDKRKNSLGLQLASDLAKQLGGTLEMKSNQVQGVVFSVVFKAAEPPSTDISDPLATAP